MAALDAELADTIRTWRGLSIYKTQVAIDRIVERLDPEARRRTDTAARSRYVDITHDREAAYLTGTLLKSDATLLERRLTAMARTVCGNDPRDCHQRRADALGALAAGRTALACACGSQVCPAAENDSTPSVVVHVVAEATTLEGADPTAVHGERPRTTPPRSSPAGSVWSRSSVALCAPQRQTIPLRHRSPGRHPACF